MLAGAGIDRRFRLLLALALALTGPGIEAVQWPRDLIIDSGFEPNTTRWLIIGDGGVDRTGDRPHLVLRTGSAARLPVILPPGSATKYLAVVGLGTGDVVAATPTTAGLPLMTAQFFDDTGRVLVVRGLRPAVGRTATPGEWVQMSMVAQIPERAATAILMAGPFAGPSASRGPATARFSAVTAYVVDTERHAFALVAALAPRRVGVGSDEDVKLNAAVPAPIFDPAKSAVFGEEFALDFVTQCSRSAPWPVQGTWPVDAASVTAVEAALPPLLQQALARRAASFTPADYVRQYIGLIVDGRRILYVNAIAEPAAGRPDPESWRTQPARMCDGGVRAWGAEFDVASKIVVSLRFNSPR